MNTSSCPHCGGIHTAKCPLIKAIDYHEDGTVKRVEFYAPKDYREIKTKSLHELMREPMTNFNRIKP